MIPRAFQFGIIGYVLLCGFSVPLWATDVVAPESIEKVEILDAESLILLAQGLDDLQLIDSRLPQDRAMGYIEPSINLSDLDTNCASLNRSLPDHNQAVVFYSNGVQCDRSARALSKARDCGYTRLYWLRGGFDEWRQRDYSYLLE